MRASSSPKDFFSSFISLFFLFPPRFRPGVQTPSFGAKRAGIIVQTPPVFFPFPPSFTWDWKMDPSDPLLVLTSRRWDQIIASPSFPPYYMEESFPILITKENFFFSPL